MNSIENRAYQKGYQAGRRDKWGLHLPPEVPEKHMNRVIVCAKSLRDSADMICSQLMEDDYFCLELAPKIDALDEAFIEINKWMTSVEIES